MIKDWIKSSKPSRNFEGFHKCVEPIDDLHIELAKKPTFKLVLTNYWNKHDHYNVVLQVVCDAFDQHHESLPTKKDWEMKQKMILIRNYENGK